MNETQLDDRQRQALSDMRKTMLVVAKILTATVDNYDRAMSDDPSRCQNYPSMPSGWEMPADEAWNAPSGRFRWWIEPTREPWQIGDHEFDELEVEE